MEKNNVVRYHNDLNAITFYRFGSIDFDLFMSICSRMADQGEAEIVIGFDDLKEMSGFNTHWSEKRFIEMLDDMGGKQLLSQGRIQKENKITRFQLFPEMTIDGDQRILTVKANEKYLYILNDLKKNFTRFELQEFINLESKYSKNLYRLLKQYRKAGKYVIEASKFRELMDCPAVYPNKEFMRVCVNVAVKELSRGYFEDLKVTPIRDIGRGRPIIAYEFTFKKSSDIPGQYRIDDYQETPPQKKEKKGKKNRFNNFNQRDYDFSEYERMLLQGSGTTGEQRENGKTD